MSNYKANTREGLPMYGRERPIPDANDPFGTLRTSRWTNPETAGRKRPQPVPEAPQGPQEPPSRPLAGALAGVGGAAARSVRQMGQLMPNWRAWLEARRALEPSEPTYVRDEAKHRTLINRFSGIAALSDTEEQMIGHITSTERRLHQASTELAVEGETSPRPMFIVSGWAARVRRAPNTRPQIVGLLVPGDGIAIRGCSEPRSTTSIIAQTTLETVDGSQLLKMAQDERFPGVGHAIGRLAVQDEEFLVNQIIRLSGMTPPERLAHLILELRWRLGEAGLADDRGFELPLERSVLASAIGTTPRRVDGALGELKRINAMRLSYGEAEVISAAKLARISAFSPPRGCACGQQACDGGPEARIGATPRPLIDGTRG